MHSVFDSSAALPSPPMSRSSSGSSLFDSSDSSSVASPLVGPTVVSTPEHVHPLSASSKATRPPPLYFKRVQFTPPSTPPTAALPSKVAGSSAVNRPEPSSPTPVSRRRKPDENQIWENALSRAIDAVDGNIDLSDHSLTHIPPSIADLANLVVLSKALPSLSLGSPSPASKRPFSRVVSAPLSTAAHRPLVDRSKTATNGLLFGPRKSAEGPLTFKQKHAEIQLYLGNNSISKLPSELFSLRGLTVLSLRGNRLETLPPAIGSLENLKELNISNNRLEFLPSEILNLNLTSLALHPNRFRQSPPDAVVLPDRSLSPLKISLPRLLSLKEICARVLLSPSPYSDSQGKTILESTYSLPLSSNSCPEDFASIVVALTSHRVDASMDVTFNKCSCRSLPSTKRSSIFVHAAEERTEWLGLIAGITVAESDEGRIPVLWRGCARGCLRFLDGGLEETVDIDGFDVDSEFELDA